MRLCDGCVTRVIGKIPQAYSSLIEHSVEDAPPADCFCRCSRSAEAEAPGPAGRWMIERLKDRPQGAPEPRARSPFAVPVLRRLCGDLLPKGIEAMKDLFR